jgi:hypothetical protein
MLHENGISLNFDCPKGDAIFYTSFLMAHSPSEFEKLSNDVMDAMQYLSHLDKDRTIVLVGELIVENAIENYLSASMRGYKKEFSKLSFYLKIRIAKSLNLSPPKIFECADIIRAIRNEFVHDLNITDFANIKTELTKKLDNALIVVNYKTNQEERTMREKFVMLILATTTALFICTKDACLLNSFLRSDSFQKNLLDYYKT